MRLYIKEIDTKIYSENIKDVPIHNILVEYKGNTKKNGYIIYDFTIIDKTNSTLEIRNETISLVYIFNTFEQHIKVTNMQDKMKNITYVENELFLIRDNSLKSYCDNYCYKMLIRLYDANNNEIVHTEL